MADQELSASAEDLDADGVVTRLQHIADETSREFGRPAGIDDHQLRLLVYTEQKPDEVDRVRLFSMMKRQFTPDVLNWFSEHGLYTETSTFVIPGNESIGLHTRVCAPIRCDGYLLGFLWLTDRNSEMSVADRRRLDVIAAEAGLVLYRRLTLQQHGSQRARELCGELLSEDVEGRRAAAERLAELELFPADAAVAVLVVPMPKKVTGLDAERVRVMVEGALARARRRLSGPSLQLVRRDHAAVVVALGRPGTDDRNIRALAHGLGQDLRDRVPPLRADGDVVVAIGGPAGQLPDAVLSYRQARQAAELSTLGHAGTGADDESGGDSSGDGSGGGRVVAWADLGVYATLIEVGLGGLEPGHLHPGLLRLIDEPRHHDLARTLECYLDRAGDTQATAGELYLHRTTLYHRLRQIEKIVGADLGQGDDRLILHLGLKLARLSGRTWSPEHGAVQP